jgi:hypothetical protein
MTISNEYDTYWELDDYDDLRKEVIFARLKEIGHTRVCGEHTRAWSSNRVEEMKQTVAMSHTCSKLR